MKLPIIRSLKGKTTMDLNKINLMEIPCPHDTTIEIVGIGTLPVGTSDNLLAGIYEVYWALGGKEIEELVFLAKITLLDYDPAKKFVKVSLKP